MQWRHNRRDSVSNRQPKDCFYRLFRRRSKKTLKLRVTGFCAGNSPRTGEFPARMASNAENVSIWWRHHGYWWDSMKHNHMYFTQFVYTQCKVLHVQYAMSSLIGSDHVEARTWWRHQMEIFSALLAICAGNSPVSGEFPAQRPVTRSFDVFFDLCLNKRLRKPSRGWWFETISCPLWRHCNENRIRCNVISGAAQSLNRTRRRYIFSQWLISCSAIARKLVQVSVTTITMTS